MKRFAIVLFLIATVLLALPINTSADGMAIPKPNYTIDETDQKAVIWHDGKTETLILSITFKGNTDEFAWVIPVPAKPEVEAGVDELFTGLAELTNVSTSRTPDLVGFGALGLDNAEKSTVTVIETKKVDIYDIAVLTAEDTTDLREWLEDNDYEYPENKEHLLSSYVNKDWYFVAAKVDAESLSQATNLKTGHATPLKITFDSEKIVYPLKISGMESEETTTKDNKLINAFSFEDGTVQGWYGGKVISGDAKHGTKIYSYEFESPYYSPQSDQAQTTSKYVNKTITGLTAGKSYVFSAYVKASPGTTGYARLTVDYTIKSIPIDLKNANDWTRIVRPFEATKSYHTLNLSGEDVSMGSTLYWDAIQIEETGEDTKASEFTNELFTTTYTYSPKPTDNYVDLLVYVFSDHKQEVPGWNVGYAGKVDSKTIKRLALDDNGDPWIDAKKSMYLTSLSRTMKQSEMTADVYFRESANDTPVGAGTNNPLSLNLNIKILLVLGIPILAEVLIFSYIWNRRYKK